METIGFTRSFKNNLNNKFLNVVTLATLVVCLILFIAKGFRLPLELAVIFFIAGRLVIILDDSMNYICPSCTHSISYRFGGKHCSNCGAKISWEEVQKKRVK